MFENWYKMSKAHLEKQIIRNLIVLSQTQRQILIQSSVYYLQLPPWGFQCPIKHKIKTTNPTSLVVNSKQS